MAELVDALGLGSSEVIRGGSSPLIDIRIFNLNKKKNGELAQLVEQGLCKAKVRSSSLLFSINQLRREVWNFKRLGQKF